MPYANCSKAMQWLNVSFSAWFNAKRQRVGHMSMEYNTVSTQVSRFKKRLADDRGVTLPGPLSGHCLARLRSNVKQRSRTLPGELPDANAYSLRSAPYRRMYSPKVWMVMTMPS